MVRRFTCYIVFVTLIWSAYTDDEKKIPDIMFKSDMTRKDFSNLLSSLIKLNEKRVNVLQKLYRLEDYGALSEVLRSGDDKNANPSNLFLIVMSKNPTDSLRRNNNFQVTSLEVAGRNKIPKLDYVLDPSSFINQNVRKDNALPKSIFANAPRYFKPKVAVLFDNINAKNTTTTTLHQHRKPKKRKHDNKILKTSKTTHKAKVLRKGNGTQDSIMSNNKNPDTTKTLLYTSTLGYTENITQYRETEVILTNNKLKDKLKTVKDILFSNRNKSRNYFIGKVEVLNSRDEDIENNRSKSTTKINGDFPTKKRFGNHHLKLEANKLVSEISNKIMDQIYRLKPESNNVSKENDNSINTLNFNNHPKRVTNKSPSTHPKLFKYNSNLFKLGNEKFETVRNATALRNDPNINVTVDSDKASESNNFVFNTSSINNFGLSINKDEADADYDFMINDKRKNVTEVLAPLKFPETTILNKKYDDALSNQKNIIESSNKDETETTKVVRNAGKQSNIKPIKVKSYDNEETINDGEQNNEVFTIIVTDDRNGKTVNNQPKGLELAINEFDQPEVKPVARKAFKKCLNKKARKLCIKSCNSAYRNVCLRLRCTSRSKKALKKECKKSCSKTFDSGKYSDDESDCDDSGDSN